MSRFRFFRTPEQPPMFEKAEKIATPAPRTLTQREADIVSALQGVSPENQRFLMRAAFQTLHPALQRAVVQDIDRKLWKDMVP